MVKKKKKKKTQKKQKKKTPLSAGESGDLGSIPGPGRSPGRGNGNPLQYSCLENSMDRGAWRATVHRSQRVRHRGLRATGIFKVFNHQKDTGNDHLEEPVPEKFRKAAPAWRCPQEAWSRYVLSLIFKNFKSSQFYFTWILKYFNRSRDEGIIELYLFVYCLWSYSFFYDFLGGSVVKNPPANVGDSGDTSSIPGSGKSLGGGNDNPLQYSCLGNPMDRGAWWATVHETTKSQTQLSDWARTLLFSIHRWFFYLKCKGYEKDTVFLYTHFQPKTSIDSQTGTPPVFSYSEHVCVCLCVFEREVPLLVFFPQNVWGSMLLTV